MGKRLDHSPKKQHCWYKAFLLGLFFSAAFFIPYIVRDNGYFLYYGDFNVQQVPFYQMVHDAVRNGQWQWSYTTDLGSSLIGSYTFYLLGSPFFWLTLPFPSEMVPRLMGPLLILKFACASLTGYIYLKRYTRHKHNAVIGGLMYAFSGFSVYNVFFNHFHEAIVVFPLLLAAIDEYMYRKRRGVVAIAVFAACIMNYYFFVGMVSFVIIYWFLKTYIGSWKLNLKEFLPLAFEVLIGFTATAVLLVPTVLYVTQNPRLNDFPVGYDALLYNSVQRYMHIFTSFFFPPDIPARPNFTPDSNSKWASVAAWLPLFGMTGVIAFLNSGHKNWLKKLLPFLLISTMIPIMNAIFQMFVMTYYARWFYMLTLMMSLATVLAIENSRTDWHKAINTTMVITTFVTFAIGLMPNGNTEDDGANNILDTVGLEEYQDRFWIYTSIAMLSIAVTTLLVRSLKKNKKTFYPKAVACLGVIIVLYSAYIIGLGKTHSYDVKEFIIPHVLHQEEEIDLGEDLTNVRSDFFDTMDNIGMFWQIPTIQAFHSIVPGSVYEFYPTVGVTRDVASRPETQYYGIRSLLSVKYVFDYSFDSSDFQNSDGQTRMPGYKFVGKQNGFNIFENKNYLPYGFYFDEYITRDQYDECTEENRHLLLLKAMVLSDEQAEKYGGLMTHLKDTSTLTYDADTFAADCAKLKENTCSKFEYGNGSFKARITTPQGSDKLVFFSVPFENGWSAKVNGEAVDIEEVDVGFMAVRVPGGQMSDIEFTYKTPGLNIGIIITVVSIALYISYMIISAKNHKIKPKLKMKKKYEVAAIGEADELGERYKNLVLGRKAMKKKPTFGSRTIGSENDSESLEPNPDRDIIDNEPDNVENAENTASLPSRRPINASSVSAGNTSDEAASNPSSNILEIAEEIASMPSRRVLNTSSDSIGTITDKVVSSVSDTAESSKLIAPLPSRDPIKTLSDSVDTNTDRVVSSASDTAEFSKVTAPLPSRDPIKTSSVSVDKITDEAEKTISSDNNSPQADPLSLKFENSSSLDDTTLAGENSDNKHDKKFDTLSDLKFGDIFEDFKDEATHTPDTDETSSSEAESSSDLTDEKDEPSVKSKNTESPSGGDIIIGDLDKIINELSSTDDEKTVDSDSETEHHHHRHHRHQKHRGIFSRHKHHKE